MFQEAEFSSEDEIEFAVDDANSNALDSSALPQNSRRYEPAIYSCEKEEVETCYDESRLILDVNDDCPIFRLM